MIVMAHQSNYTHGYHRSVLKTHQWRTIENSAEYLRPYLQPERDLLDVGCGVGSITVDFAKLLSTGTVTGIDVSDEVIVKAEALAEQESVSNVSFQQADLYQLPFPDQSFDIVHTHQVLHHLDDPVAALVEMARVTRPGGVIGVREVDYQGTFWYPRLDALTLWMDIYQQVHRSNHGEPDAGRHLQQWAKQAGLNNVELSSSNWVFHTEEQRLWWGESWAERATLSSFAEQAVDRGFATKEQLEDIAAGWRAWSQDPDGILVMPHVELIVHIA